jgi:hypothetical protein
MMQFKHVLGPSIPINEARVWRLAKTPFFYAYAMAFAGLASLFHPYAPLHAAPVAIQTLFWVVGFAGFMLFYTVIHLVVLRLSLRFGVRTISETLIMVATLTMVAVVNMSGLTLIGVQMAGVWQVVSFFVFCVLLFEIGAYGYLKLGDRALFPEIYYPTDAQPPAGRSYEIFLRGTSLPVAKVEIIRALDKGIEVTGMNQTFTVKRSLKTTLSELPVTLGIQIHRTIWVSHQLARQYITENGTLFVTTSDGKRFPVARSRQAEFLSWLQMMA